MDPRDTTPRDESLCVGFVYLYGSGPVYLSGYLYVWIFINNEDYEQRFVNIWTSSLLIIFIDLFLLLLLSLSSLCLRFSLIHFFQLAYLYPVGKRVSVPANELLDFRVAQHRSAISDSFCLSLLLPLFHQTTRINGKERDEKMLCTIYLMPTFGYKIVTNFPAREAWKNQRDYVLVSISRVSPYSGQLAFSSYFYYIKLEKSCDFLNWFHKTTKL